MSDIYDPAFVRDVFDKCGRNYRWWSMIGQYTRNFRDCAGLAEELRKQGLQVTYRRHFFGCATSVSGRKKG